MLKNYTFIANFWQIRLLTSGSATTKILNMPSYDLVFQQEASLLSLTALALSLEKREIHDAVEAAAAFLASSAGWNAWWRHDLAKERRCEG